MEKFVVSARKYRPITFETVVGQNHITTTLKNSIKSNHLAHAFLFCGPRGVGKTTTARILAKTINCFNITADTEPCDVCESCVSFNEGRSLNISELDAASNNSVDDIRNLVDNVRYAPQLGKYRVFIIDEVHMLSNQAFNAFLKTLEEPPAHAIFILATTEKHKIIPTILSRCQIFDFNRIKVDDMAKHLAQIAVKENIPAEEAGLHIIAQKADGALRDALSMFDQIVTFNNGSITYRAVIDNLNILDHDYYFKIVDEVLNANVGECLMIYNGIYQLGFEGNHFINGFAQHLRNLLVSKDAVTLQLLDVAESIKEKYKTQSSACSLRFLVDALALCTKTEAAYKQSINQRLLVELTLMQICGLVGLKNADEKKKPELINTKSETSVNKIEVIGQKIEVKNPITNDALVGDTITKVEEPSVEVKKFVSPKSLNLASVSIDTLLNKNKVEEKQNQATTIALKKENVFTEEELQTAWNIFAETIKQKGKQSLHNSLTSYKPLLKENFAIDFKVNNTVQETEINNIITDLTSHLRKHLQNDILSININVIKDDSERKPYTNQEKYKRMVQLNPNIELFRKSLDLEI